MTDTERRLAIDACKTIQNGDFVRMSWQFSDDVPFEEWNDQDWFTTVQGMIEDEFDISQKEIDDNTEEN